MIDETMDSVKNNFLEKISSPFYGTFIFSWILWNWEAFYITFFINSEILYKKTQLLKIDLIYQLYPHETWSDIFWLYGGYLIFGPLISVIIITFFISKVSYWFNGFLWGNREKQKNLEKTIVLEQENEGIEIEKENLNKKEEILDKKEKVTEKKIKVQKSQEETWKEEYKEFKKSSYFSNFSKLIEEIESNNYRNYIESNFNSKTLKYFKIKNIIIIEGTNYSFTEKGNKFVDFFLDSSDDLAF